MKKKADEATEEAAVENEKKAPAVPYKWKTPEEPSALPSSPAGGTSSFANGTPAAGMGTPKAADGSSVAAAPVPKPSTAKMLEEMEAQKASVLRQREKYEERNMGGFTRIYPSDDPKLQVSLNRMGDVLLGRSVWLPGHGICNSSRPSPSTS